MKSFYARLLVALWGFAVLYNSLGTLQPADADSATPSTTGPTETTNGTYPSLTWSSTTPIVMWHPCPTSGVRPAKLKNSNNSTFVSTTGVFCVDSHNVKAQPLGAYACTYHGNGWCLGSVPAPCPGYPGNLSFQPPYSRDFYLTVSDFGFAVNAMDPTSWPVAGGMVHFDTHGNLIFTVQGDHGLPLKYWILSSDFSSAVKLAGKQTDFTDTLSSVMLSAVTQQINWGDAKNKSVVLNGVLSCINPIQIDGKWKGYAYNSKTGTNTGPAHGGSFDITEFSQSGNPGPSPSPSPSPSPENPSPSPSPENPSPSPSPENPSPSPSPTPLNIAGQYTVTGNPGSCTSATITQNGNSVSISYQHCGYGVSLGETGTLTGTSLGYLSVTDPMDLGNNVTPHCTSGSGCRMTESGSVSQENPVVIIIKWSYNKDSVTGTETLTRQ